MRVEEECAPPPTPRKDWAERLLLASLMLAVRKLRTRRQHPDGVDRLTVAIRHRPREG